MSRSKKTCRKTSTKKFIKLLVAVLWIGIASASWASGWEELSPGLRYQSPTVDAYESTIYLVEVDLSRYRLDILRAAEQGSPRLRLRRLIQDPEIAAAINASFFDEEGRAMGLVIRNGEVLNLLRQTSWGIFQIVAGVPSVIHTRDFKADPKRTLAIQSGPRLVVQGRIPSFKDSAIAPRSAVCVTATGRVILAATPSPLTLKQWAQALQPHCPNALNFDGGASSQFYVKAKDLYLPGGEPVPNALAAIAK